MALPHDTFTYRVAKFTSRLRTLMVAVVLLNIVAGIMLMAMVGFGVLGLILFIGSVNNDSARTLALGLTCFAATFGSFMLFTGSVTQEERLRIQRAEVQDELDKFIAEAEGTAPRPPIVTDPNSE